MLENKLNNNWDNIYIDIIDSIDANEDLTHLINHPSNISLIGKRNKHVYPITHAKTNPDLIKAKLHITELFHIYNYYSEGKYKLINKYEASSLILSSPFISFINFYTSSFL